MQTLRLDLPDPVYAEAQRAAEDGGYPDMASYVAALISQDTETFDHLFTPERLAVIDQAVEEADAGKVLTMEQAEARSAEMKAKWRRANLGLPSSLRNRPTRNSRQSGGTTPQRTATTEPTATMRF